MTVLTGGQMITAMEAQACQISEMIHTKFGAANKKVNRNENE